MSLRLVTRVGRVGVLLGLLFAVAGAARADDSFRAVTLANGLTVLLAPSHEHPVIALSGFVTTGGRTEDVYYQGSLHYIEHLVFKGGTPNMEPTEFRKKMSLLGRESGGWTWDDEINFGFEVPKETFPEALEVYREALLDLQYEEQWFEDEKLVVLQEMKRGEEQPGQKIYRAWRDLAFTRHSYGLPVIGSEKAIRELEMTKTEQYYRERFTPNHMILSIAGDFDDDAMIGLIEEVWGALEPGPDSFELGIEEPPQAGPRMRIDHMEQATDARLLTGLVTPGGRHDDTSALFFLAGLMNDTSFGLPQFLVEQEKWVTSVSASHYAMRDYGTFTVSARTDPAKEPAVREFVNAFLLSFDARDVPGDIFESTRQSLLFEEAQARDAAASRAGRLGFLASRLGLEGAAAYTDRIAALTADDVQAAKERWFGPRRLVTAAVLPDGWDPEGADADAVVHPGAPYAAPPPDLDRPGLLRPAEAAPLSFAKTEEADGVSQYTYANGLRVLVRPTAASELLAISGRVLGGQWVEDPGREGINRFVAEAGLRSARHWNREGFNRLLETRSMDASAHTYVGSRANTSRNVDYRDSGAHHYFGLRDEWATMLACLKETLYFPDFGTDEIEKLREDLLNEIRSLPENNLEYIKQEFYVAAYEGHPYGRPTVGTEESISAMTADDLAAFHAAHWLPERTVVAVVGDVDPDEVAEWIAAHWSELPAASGSPWVPPHERPASWRPPSDLVTLDLGKNYWTVNWGRPGCSYDADDFFVSAVLSRMAGNDHFYKYVYGEGVSYRSWIRFWENLGAGTWILENDVKQERFDDILAMFDEDLVRYSTEGFPEQEFEDAVQRLVNSQILDAQNNARLAWSLALTEGNGVGFRRATGAVDRLRAVTYEEVQALAAEVFAPDEFLRMVQQ